MGNTVNLIQAIKKGRLEAANQFIKAGAEIEAEDPEMNGWTPLVYAVRFNQVAIVQELIVRWNADLEHETKTGMTPFLHAALSGNIPCLELLVEHGANVNAVDQSGMSGLHWAVSNGRYSAVKYLCRHGCDVTIRDTNGKTALDIAQDNKNKKIVAFMTRDSWESRKMDFSPLQIWVSSPDSADAPLEESLEESGGHLTSLRKRKRRGPPSETGSTPSERSSVTSSATSIPPQKLELSVSGSDGMGEEPQQNAIDEWFLSPEMDMRDRTMSTILRDQEIDRMKEEVRRWLKDLNLERYFPIFVDNGFDRMDAIIYGVSKDDLLEIGIKRGHVNVILGAIGKVRSATEDEIQVQMEKLQMEEKKSEEGIAIERQDTVISLEDTPALPFDSSVHSSMRSLSSQSRFSASMSAEEKRKLVEFRAFSVVRERLPTITYDPALDDDDEMDALYNSGSLNSPVGSEGKILHFSHDSIGVRSLKQPSSSYVSDRMSVSQSASHVPLGGVISNQPRPDSPDPEQTVSFDMDAMYEITDT